MRTPRHEPERKCIVSGERGSRDSLIRLALGPDGAIAPDVRAKAGGRGAWIGIDRATLEKAIAAGKLAGMLARTLKAGPVDVPGDLPGRIEEALRRIALDRLGLEARAGNLITGADRIEQAARRGQVRLLLHAADAAGDGKRRLDQALRVGSDVAETDGAAAQSLVLLADRAMLSAALGRENAVHAAIADTAAAGRVAQEIGRWHRFVGVTAPSVLAESGASVHGGAAHAD